MWHDLTNFLRFKINLEPDFLKILKAVTCNVFLRFKMNVNFKWNKYLKFEKAVTYAAWNGRLKIVW